MKQNTVMIVGLGELGGNTLEILARVPNMAKIIAADIREDWGVRKTNSAVIGASQLGLYPDIEFVQLDAFDVEKTAKVLQEVRPTILFNGMTLQSWWVITQLPPDAYQAIDDARYGPWYPMHFVPTYKLMQAVRKSGIETHVVNSAFPDLVNPALAKIGLAPTVGIGNLDNSIHGLRIAVSKMLRVPLRSVNIYWAAHHYVHYYVSRFGNSGGAPYKIKIMVDDKDVTSKINVDELLAQATTVGKRPGGVHSTPVVASSVCKIILGILFNTKELGHAPGPNGLPGGYPVRLSSGGSEVFLPGDWTLEEAIRVNDEGQVFEGAESIQGDGTVVITDKAANIFKKLLDFDCKVYTVKDCEAKARELDEKFKRWAAKFKS